MNQNIFRSLRFPVAFVALLALIMTPALFVSAADSEGEQPTRPRGQGIPVEIVSISTGDFVSGTIEATLTIVPEVVAAEHGFQTGDTVTILFDEETKFFSEREEVDVNSFDAGSSIFIRGEVDFDAGTIDANIIADQKLRSAHPRVGEVVEVDTGSNTVLVKGLRPDSEGNERYVFVTYDDETLIHEDGESADETAISVGDKIRVKGEVDLESENYFAEIDAANIVLFDETEPERPKHRPSAE